MSRILVAGGAGFLGSHLSELLLSHGHEIVIVDDLSSGLLRNIEPVRDRVTFISSDIVSARPEGDFDVVINLASRASRIEWETFPVHVALTNSAGNNNLISISRESDALYIYASSSEVYGNPSVVPTPEDYLGRVSTTGTRSPYDEGKRFGESLVKAYERQYGLKTIIIRFFNTYGPRMRGGDLYGRVIDRFIKQATSGTPLTVYGDGSQTRSFTYVDDSVRAINTLIEKGRIGEVYNVGSDKEIRIIDLAEKIIEVTDSRSRIEFRELPPDDPVRRSADISRMRSIGWKPVTSLHDGVRRTIGKLAEDQ